MRYGQSDIYARCTGRERERLFLDLQVPQHGLLSMFLYVYFV